MRDVPGRCPLLQLLEPLGEVFFQFDGVFGNRVWVRHVVGRLPDDGAEANLWQAFFPFGTFPDEFDAVHPNDSVSAFGLSHEPPFLVAGGEAGVFRIEVPEEVRVSVAVDVLEVPVRALAPLPDFRPTIVGDDQWFPEPERLRVHRRRVEVVGRQDGHRSDAPLPAVDSIRIATRLDVDLYHLVEPQRTCGVNGKTTSHAKADTYPDSFYNVASVNAA